jgi:hypothetical protein
VGELGRAVAATGIRSNVGGGASNWIDGNIKEGTIPASSGAVYGAQDKSRMK